MERSSMNCIASDASTPVRAVSSMPCERDGQVLRVRVAVERDELRLRAALRRLEDHLAVAEHDPVAGPERQRAAMSCAPLSSVPLTLPQSRTTHSPSMEHDLRVLAREIAVLDRDRALGGAAEGDGRAGRADLHRREVRLKHGELDRPRFHDVRRHCNRASRYLASRCSVSSSPGCP